LFEVIASKEFLFFINYFYSKKNLLLSLTYESFSYNVQRASQTSSIGEQLRNLRRKFSDRTDTIKEIIHQPPDFERDTASENIYLFSIGKNKLIVLFLL